MPLDWSRLEFIYQGANDAADAADVLAEYIEYIANKSLLRYKYIVQYGGKSGESVWTHIMNLVTVIEKLRPLFQLNADEMRCLLLALTIHDLNKVDAYGKSPNGKNASYANAASKTNIVQELDMLDATSFFPDWSDYRFDITYLAHAHQEGSMVETVLNQREIDKCHLNMDRLEGPLKFLMKAADVSDNSHSGDFTQRHEKHIRDKLRDHVNSALNADGHPRRYRFVGHHLAEQRGLTTNVMHNVIVTYMLETYGKEACIDLLYHPEGVDYLLDRKIPFTWTRETQQTVAERIGQRFAKLQSDQLAQFIKATPSGIGVDDAAMQSGASIEVIFGIIANVVVRKQYRLEWREERNRLVRSDLTDALSNEKISTEVKEQINALLQETNLVPTDEEVLKRGEFVTAYRNFLKDHRSEQLKAVKQDAWSRVARLFQLSETSDALYAQVDPYRRGYFLARDLSTRDVEAMVLDALEDMKQLEAQAAKVQAARKPKKSSSEETVEISPDVDEIPLLASFDTAYIVDYLERHLEVWDSLADTSVHTRPVQTIDFAETLRRYADPRQPHKQCCYCGSALKADEWMAIQVPPNIGVQSFSNRLEAGSNRDPKRNVCDICRTQFILEKLAWRSHRDKQGGEQVTFYLHLFPYSYFTQPMLLAWWQSITNLRDTDHSALFLDTQEYFSEWERYNELQAEVSPRYYRSSTEGLGMPTFADALSNTPVLPLIISGGNYGIQFLIALEKTALLARWFDSRVILSRMPVPSLNLANEYIGNEPDKPDKPGEPVALLVENPPQSMSWLVPQTAFIRKDVDTMCRKLCKVHQLADRLAARDEKFEEKIYDLVVAAASDPLALYYEVDRLIEQQVMRKKGRKPEYQAMSLSHAIAPVLTELTKL
ncbi:MAG: type I-D CRISPR-associated protein Cas10d/Csc3 [Ktedonobacteraceae bacterium]